MLGKLYHISMRWSQFSLKQEWCNEILMINIALFCLKKTDILANPVEQILSGDYLNGIQTIINNDLQTQREIAAFGIWCRC